MFNWFIDYSIRCAKRKTDEIEGLALEKLAVIQPQVTEILKFKSDYLDKAAKI